MTFVDAVAQAVYTRMKLYQGDWWEDIVDGLPMFNRILGFRNTQNAADILIRERIINTTDVSGIVDFDSSFDNSSRKYSCKATINTVYGTTQIEVII